MGTTLDLQNKLKQLLGSDNVYFGDSRRDGDSGSSSYGGNVYGAAPAAGSYGGYSAPSGAPASDFAMLEDDDAQLPF